jgi:hypothetical protein
MGGLAGAEEDGLIVLKKDISFLQVKAALEPCPHPEDHPGRSSRFSQELLIVSSAIASNP